MSDAAHRHALPRRGFLGLSAGAVLLAAGCRSATDPAADGAKGASATASAPDLQIVYGSAPDPTQLLHRGPDTPAFVNLVLDRLVDLDPQTLQPVPWLATSWEWSADRLKLVLKLREDVTFHDGRALSADDVVFSLVGAAKTSQVKPLLERLADIRASAGNEVTLTLARPTSNLFDALAFNPVVDARSYVDGKAADKVNGTGPFTWQSFKGGNQLDLARYDRYWQSGRPRFERITIRSVTSSQAALSALQSGQAQLIGAVPGRDLKVLAGNPGFTVQSAKASYQQAFLGVNIATKPFDDIRVRQALQYAVDRERIVSQVYGGSAEASSLPWPSNTPGVTPDQVKRYGHDPEKARGLLKEAGAEGARVPLTAANSPVFTSLVELVKFDLEQAGFGVDVQLLDNAAIQPKIQQGTLEGLFVANHGMVSVSPLSGITVSGPLQVGKNTSHVTDPAFAELQSRAFAAVDEKARADVNHELSEYLLAQSFHITLAHAWETYALASSVHDVATSALGYLRLTDTRRDG
ncbi:ABC transporter substrate-binding protein [Kitasatospora sp. NPDC092286]|uniref:ABC transporter substrate-binding protein n=1 Tax=Kitasatospora sp. NPDC092286 TaxID=3364087 RepID=UPI003812DA44